MSWPPSLSPWLYWSLLAPLVLLGNGVIWVGLLASNDIALPVPQWLDYKEKEGRLVRGLRVTLGLVLAGLAMNALVASFFIPSIFYRFVLGWALDNAMPAGVFTTIGLIVLANWFEGRRDLKREQVKAKLEMDAALRTRRRRGPREDGA